MHTIEKSIDVGVPVTVAYNQWTQFEEFPHFMEGVEQVEQLDDTHLRWSASIGGKQEQWRSEITEQQPDRRVAWKSTEGAHHAGVVTFHRLSDDSTRVMLQMEYEPKGILEKVGDFFGAFENRVTGDLKRFKEFIEERGTATGGYRGEVPPPHERGAQH